ncbi:HAD family hydrolase [Sphingomonas hengshuiensis]|uniref:Haloacid dehalogenase n=1 Tax=Sphingomonas hengshuiensis TaxID=1609977 RepID=A0A7U5BG41_9SPHN|nr:HAD-IB family hydrolase [Sphingomonas hengshuiensis]AJP74631.1 haloacid dehalogenase [Sphingomonas hengshuiensis]
MQHLAIYDMDKTITAAPTWTRFLLHAARMHAAWRLALLPVVGLAGIGYAARLIDRARLKQIAQRLLLGSALTPAALERLAESFAEAEAGTGVLQGARDRIAADRAAGYRLVMATASHGYYAGAIARRLGFDDVIATRARRDGQGRILSLIDGHNCYGPVKLRMIEDWMSEFDIDRAGQHIRAYSDHVSDAPLLEWADEPFAVNAHGPLLAMAAVRGWPVLDWR